MADFGQFRGFGDKLFQGQLPTKLGLIGSIDVNPLILDDYPNAAAAYSLRKLRSAYTLFVVVGMVLLQLGMTKAETHEMQRKLPQQISRKSLAVGV